jgi:hypothetical protein
MLLTCLLDAGRGKLIGEEKYYSRSTVPDPDNTAVAVGNAISEFSPASCRGIPESRALGWRASITT